MIRTLKPNRVPWTRRLLAAAFLAIAFAAPACAQPETPVPTPNGDTAFIGSVRVTFPLLANALRGKIYYNLEGTPPGLEDKEYTEALTITTNCVLAARRYRNGNWSSTNYSEFRKQKLPMPTLVYEGKPEFTGVKKVTLSLNMGSNPTNGKNPALWYTTDGGNPDSLYTSTLNIGRTSLVRAWAIHPDYDTSHAAQQAFTLLIPVEKPVVNPKGQVFSTPTLSVNFSTTTLGAFFMHSFGAGTNPEAGSNIGPTALIRGGNPGDTVVLNVVAKKDNMATSPLAVEKYVYRPLPASPLPSPQPFTFQDTVTISLSSATPDAEIHYTLDGSIPTLSTPLYDHTKKIKLDSTAQLRAMAYKTGWGNSDGFSGTFVLSLSNPTPSIGSSEFQDSIKFVLNAKNPSADIFYTLDGFDPTNKSTHYNRKALDSILLTKDSTEMRVIAIKGNVKSPIKSYVYAKSNKIRTTLPPVIEPAGQDFLDTIPVTLSVSDPLATIWYTLEGGAKTQYVKGKPIVVRSSSLLKAYATRPDRDQSEERSEEFVQVPSPPTANPIAAEPVPNRLVVRLSSKVPGASILYLLEKQNFERALAKPYGPSDTPLVFIKDTYLQAVAITGTGSRNRMSQVMVQEYVVYQASVGDSVPPGLERDLSRGMALVNKGTSALQTKLIPFEQLNLKGFTEATHAVTVSAGPGQPVPKAVITRPAGQEQAIYRIEDGKAYFHGVGPSVEIPKAGTYFAAVDTQPPVLSIVAVETKTNQGATVKMHAADNVAKPAYEVRGTGIADRIADAADGDGYFSFTLKNPDNVVKDLWFRAEARDLRDTGRFPPAGGNYFLSQAWSKLTVQNAWNTGIADQPYDLAGLPIGSEASLTWAQIKIDNPDPALTGYFYRDGGHVALKDGDVMEPGIAFWLGSRHSRSSLTLSKFHTQPSGTDGHFRVKTRQGWTMVTNPSLGTLYWPSARTDKDYSSKKIRALWAYDTEKMDYVGSDSLLPWRGYWVLNLTGKDSTIELLAKPKPAAKAAATGNDPRTVEILLDHGRPFPLRLGARGYAKDGVGVEDEPLLPYWNQARQGWSARDRSRLMTDVMHFESDQVLRWMVVLEGKPAPGRDSMVTVSESRMPAGFEAWALSRRRNLKVRLVPGAGYSLPGPEADTVQILAGPAAKLALLPELARAVEGVDAFQGSLRDGKQGPALFLALPTDADVKAEIWTLSGRLAHVLADSRLGSGQHVLPLPAGGHAPDARILRVRVRGEGWSRTQVLKLTR